jgi:hypothetical protein
VLLTLQPATDSVSNKQLTILATDRKILVDIIPSKNRTVDKKQQVANANARWLVPCLPGDTSKLWQ